MGVDRCYMKNQLIMQFILSTRFQFLCIHDPFCFDRLMGNSTLMCLFLTFCHIRTSGETIFAARHQFVSQGPLGFHSKQLADTRSGGLCFAARVSSTAVLVEEEIIPD